MSKGSRPRPYSISQKEFGANYDAIFGKSKQQEQHAAKVEDQAAKQVEENSKNKD